MAKFSKKVISCILSMLLVITSVPFVAFASDDALDALDTAIADYETAMDGTVYTNMADAYAAYHTAITARDSYVYGNRTDIDISSAASQLAEKTAMMQKYSATFSTVVPSFHGDDLTAYAGTAYNNIIYSPTVGSETESGYCGSAENTNSKVKYELFYAPTVFAYDGTTQLRMPVMIDAKITTEKERYLYGCYPMASADNYADHPDLKLVDYWYTGDNDSGHADGLKDGNWSFAAQVESNYQTFGYSNGTGYGANQSTDHRSQYLPNNGTLFWWGSQYFFCANVMNVNTTFADGEYVKEYQPHWYVCASESPNSTMDATTMRGSNIIYVINYKALVDAISNSDYSAVLASVDCYNKDYSDVYSLLEAFDTATSININSYNYSDPAKVTDCANAIKNACDTLSRTYAAVEESDMTDYSRLRSAIDSYRDAYDAGNADHKYSDESWANFETAYENAVAAAGDIYDNGYTGTYNEKAVSAIAEGLDFLLDKSGDCGENATFDFDSKTGVVSIDGSGEMADYDEFGTNSPFAGSTKITSVEIADGITEIGDYTFYGCSNLETVVLPATITRVGVGAFEDCTSLSTLIVPAGAVYEDDAFAGCTSLESIEFGSGAIASKNEDDHNAPWYQSTVKSITITSGVTSVGQNAFAGATNIEHLTVNCDIPVNTSSNTNAFRGMTGLKYITIAPGSTGDMIDWTNYYRRTPWYGNKDNAEMHITVANGVKSISPYAFFECSNIDDISLPTTIESIGERAFYGCSAIRDIYIYNTNCVIADSANTFHELTKIHCYEFSTAYNYATKYSRDIVLLAAHTHTYNAAVTNPSCTEQGYTTYTCSLCGDSYIADYVNPLGHNYEVKSVVPATCTASGYTVYECSRCHNEITGAETDPIPHDYIVKSVVPATCQAKGYTVYECTMCHDTYNGNETDKIPHNYIVKSVVPATCQAKGYTVYECTMCHDTYNGNETEKTAHNYELTEIVAPTCTSKGYTLYVCSECNEKDYRDIRDEIPHNYVVNGDISRASFTTEGNIPVKCTECNDTSNKRIVCPTAKLAKASYVYTGKAITPAVTLIDGDGNEISSDEYTVTYQNGRVKVGTYKVTVTFNADSEYYYGSKVLTFKIVPKGTTLAKVTSGTQTLTAQWKKQANQTKGYQIQIATDAKFTKGKKLITVKNVKTLKTTVKKLKYNTNYYVRVRTYSTVAKVNYYSPWSKAKAIVVKPVIKNAAISKLTAGKKQFTAKWKKVAGTTGYEIQYSTSAKMTKAKTVKVNGGAKTSVKVAKLLSKKKYYVRIRAVKKVGKKTYYGNWSKAKAVTVK
ncbi:MAG: fibronectin type III domain-containing protein [Ruminococcaceae bacterium]|nr:fibronectin type III domain-containing protein [Oscillospiraceae bacterium]